MAGVWNRLHPLQRRSAANPRWCALRGERLPPYSAARSGPTIDRPSPSPAWIHPAADHAADRGARPPTGPARRLAMIPHVGPAPPPAGLVRPLHQNLMRPAMPPIFGGLSREFPTRALDSALTANFASDPPSLDGDAAVAVDCLHGPPQRLDGGGRPRFRADDG